jgi:CDP-diacylglycerol--glycerol-3-phosphate 3-phosphatidyltransferase
VWLNLPNRITLGRLILAVVFFVLVSFDDPAALTWAEAVFVAACVTDFLDGYLARKYHLETAFGRIADPFVDKVIICGGFVLLAGRPVLGDGGAALIQPWMVVVLISREFLVSSIRGYAESQGVAFGAELAGKMKAVAQMVALGLAIWCTAHGTVPLLPPALSRGLTLAAVYLALVLTVASAVTYCVKARRLFSPTAGPAPPEA